MINFYDQVPLVYTSASRDFQYISWLVNIVLNAVKHNIDDIYNLPITHSDPKLTELLAMTLGFKVRRNYDKKQLNALVSILPSILRYKGTEKAIQMAAEAIVMAAGAIGEVSVETNGKEIRVTLPSGLVDIALFLDLLDYILPAGMTCRVVRKNETKKTISDIDLRHSDVINLLAVDDLNYWNINDNDAASVGLAILYDLTQESKDFTSNIKVKKVKDSPEKVLTLNAGLINNTVIPTLADSKLVTSDPDADVPSNTAALYCISGDTESETKSTEPLMAAGNVQLRAKKSL